MLETFEQLTETMHPGSAPITDFDVQLAQIELDPLQAKFHPGLFKIDPAKIESGIDAIFIAAAAGNPKAKFLILAAANNQINSAGDEALAFGELMEISEEQLEQLIVLGALHDGEAAPLEREIGIAIIDKSIAAIELALEDAGLFK